MKLVTLYTDGACEGNPGPGGWAAVLKYNDHVKEISGGVPVSTNNRMELQAAVEALRSLREPCEVRLFTDSQYVRTGISEWLDDWKTRGWRTKDKKPVKNAELWRELDKQASRHSVHWCWVKGHAGDDMNERCDLLARHEIMKVRQKIAPTELKALLDEFQQQSQSVISAGTV
jgi:ribonuclease HI